MIKNKILLIIILVAVVFSLVMPLQSEEDKDKDKSIFSGSFSVGYRGVDVDGVETKYKEDYNLDSGPKLFKVALHYQPVGKLKKYFDRLDMKPNYHGASPFETINVSLVKYGTYKFKYDRKKSSYFYRDILEGHDFNTYDFDRVNDSASLKVWLCKSARFYMGFNRYTKKGDSTTSLDINRDEFEFDRPLDEESKEITLGLEMSLKRFTLVLEEKIQDYENDYHLFLPGFSGGEDPYDPADLSYFAINQPYDFRSFTHTARINARPTDNFLIRAAAQISTQDMRLSYSESQMGTTYMGTEFTFNSSGEGEFDRKMQLYDFDISYLFSSKVAFTAAVRYRNLEQDGMIEEYGEDMMHALEFNTLGIEGGLQFQPTAKLAFSVGARHETRKLEEVEDGAEEKTERTGFFGNVKLFLLKHLRLTCDYQFGSYKDPLTPVSLTDSHRARFTARYKVKKFFASGSFKYILNKNDIDDGWESERSQVNVRFGYYDKKVKLGVGYGLVYSKQEGDRNFVFYGSPSVWNILYEGRGSLFDAYVYLFFNKKWTFGGYANYYKNDGSWEIERLILRPYLEVKFEGGFTGQVAYRYIDFKESLMGYNDYTANIFEISFGYRW